MARVFHRSETFRLVVDVWGHIVPAAFGLAEDPCNFALSWIFPCRCGACHDDLSTRFFLPPFFRIVLACSFDACRSFWMWPPFFWRGLSWMHAFSCFDWMRCWFVSFVPSTCVATRFRVYVCTIVFLPPSRVMSFVAWHLLRHVSTTAFVSSRRLLFASIGLDPLLFLAIVCFCLHFFRLKRIGLTRTGMDHVDVSPSMLRSNLFHPLRVSSSHGKGIRRRRSHERAMRSHAVRSLPLLRSDGPPRLGVSLDTLPSASPTDPHGQRERTVREGRERENLLSFGVVLHVGRAPSHDPLSVSLSPSERE